MPQASLYKIDHFRQTGGNPGSKLNLRHSKIFLECQRCLWFQSLFPGVNVLRKANGGRTISKYRTNQVVFSQGDPADSVFYIHEGKIKVTVISEQGKEAIVAILGPDEFCGEGCLAGQPRRMATATAMTKCELMRRSA
jgi:hypothetical protein